jgi:phage baseplate assembly protein W
LTRPIGKLGYIAGMDVVRQSIETILDTEPGERIMRPTFGCGLHRYLMAPNTLTTRTAMADDITAALTMWEPPRDHQRVCPARRQPNAGVDRDQLCAAGRPSPR